ncbi:MAG TPA: TIGR03936 family radical SAM-associated protein [Bacillota bacterium]|nr:DUF2344 domain-containing protein [Clostridiales bacterium]HOQ13657.1 TIGR03936 family radical SAM-associated protein [Bacillota bacterium]
MNESVLNERKAETPSTLRIRFSKTGSLQFISHLDLMRTMMRLLIRSGLKMWYSEGFNPHPKLVFALPLSIGAESVCELLDVRVYGDIDCEDLIRRLNEASTPELKFIEAYVPERKFKDIAYARYEITVYSQNLKKGCDNAMTELFRSPVIVSKRTKSGDHDTDIVPFVRSLSVEFDADTHELHVNTVLSAAPDNYLNPEYIVEAIRRATGAPSDEDFTPGGDSYSILRTEMLDSEGQIFR